MLFSNNSSLRGKFWQLTNGYWRGCNATGQQCTFKWQNEAKLFAERTIPSKHPKVVKAVLNKKKRII